MKSKLLKRDYNQELEDIAESKGFEKEAQNLLLSMLYKVDGAYDDYETVRREVPYKDEFLQNILNIVEKNCKGIEIAKPNTLLEKELEESKCKILQEYPDNKYNNEQKVIFFPNEKVVLYSLIKAGTEKIDSKLELEYKAILMAIQIGKCVAYSEVIRDFNGFSWSILENEIESIECNAIYTDLTYIIGEENVRNINSSNVKKIKKLINAKLYEEIKKVATKFYLLHNKEQKQKIDEEISKNKNELNEMNDQENFIENISKKKKENLYKIKQIDEILNNPELLRKEYLEKNKELPNEKKIFSMSHYEEKLQKERKELLKKIDEYTELQNPIEYMKRKNELESKINYYTKLDTTTILEMQKTFLQEFKEQIKDKNEKVDLLDYIYKIRYLEYLPISKTKKMKDKIDFEEVEKEAISKGIRNNLITPISNNENTDYQLLKNIFSTRNIKLEDLSIKLCVEDGKLKSKIYDGEMLDSTSYIELPKDSNVKLRKTKKVKIFS